MELHTKFQKLGYSETLVRPYAGMRLLSYRTGPYMYRRRSVSNVSVEANNDDKVISCRDFPPRVVKKQKKKVKDGRYGARVIVAETVIKNTEVVAHTIVAPHAVSSELDIPCVGLDHKSKSKLQEKKGFANERLRSAALINRIQNL
jgi:hypothetical protein